MENIKYKFKKLSPMKTKRLDNFFIKIGNNWFNLIDIHKSIQKSKINPITKLEFKLEDIKKINKSYKNLISVEPVVEESGDDRSLFSDHIELFETQINELYEKQEDMYAIIQSQQNEIEFLKK